MGAVNTTYTFTATDTITSTKMNDIIDQTTFTNDAVFDTTLAVASGKLKVNAQGITSNELAANAVITDKIADSNVTTAKISDANVTQAKFGANVAGNGPCFRVGGDATAVNQYTATKLTLISKSFDTNSNVSSSTFTPTIAGYYHIIGYCIGQSRSLFALNCYIYKNGANYASGSVADGNVYTSVSSAIVYLNGTGDYVELYASHATAGTHGVTATCDGVLVRSA